MSEQINDFDQVFRDRLSEQTAAPPPSVWDNIQSKRSFGHIVANKISTNWGMFGTLLMLLLAGSSAVVLFGEEKKTNQAFKNSTIENIELENHLFDIDKEQTSNLKVEIDTENQFTKNEEQKGILNVFNEDQQVQKSTPVVEQNYLPSAELIASLEQAAFVRPVLQDKRLSAYIEVLEGWEDARPKSFVRYYQMDNISKKGVNTKQIEQHPIEVELEEYDYVMPRVERKTFLERSSILISFTPQSVTKIMNPKYNLSSSYLKMRDKTEKTRLAYTFGAMLHYELKNHKFIETGVNYSQIYEQMDYEGEKRFSNQYDFVEIPFLVGYQDRNAKWGWEIKAGLGVQIHSSYKGYILKRLDEFGGAPEPEAQFRSGASSKIKIIYNGHELSDKQARHEVLDLEDEEENPFKTSGMLNMHLATGLVYYHSINTSFVITPSYKRSVNSITKSDALFNERLQSVGISFGARMKF